MDGVCMSCTATVPITVTSCRECRGQSVALEVCASTVQIVVVSSIFRVPCRGWSQRVYPRTAARASRTNFTLCARCVRVCRTCRRAPSRNRDIESMEHGLFAAAQGHCPEECCLDCYVAMLQARVDGGELVQRRGGATSVIDALVTFLMQRLSHC
jgi:hypothetical protein